MIFKKTTLLLCLASTLLLSNASKAEAAPAATSMKESDRIHCRAYLDEMWVRITRSWGIADKRSSEFTPVNLSFDLDRKGNVSNVSIEKNSLGIVINERLRKTFETCSPFPPSPLKSATQLHVSCKLQAQQGNLSLDLQVPEFGVANALDVGVISDADLLNGLRDTLRTTSGKPKINALIELKELGSKAQPALPEILAGIKDKDDSIFYRSFEALEAMGPAAKGALPEMIKCLKGADDRARRSAVAVIGAIGPDAEEALPLLLEGLDDNDSGVKSESAKALHKMGPAVSQKAVQTLMQSSFHEYITFVPDIVATFGAEAVPALIKGTEDSDGHMVHHSVESLQKMGDAAAPAVPALIKLIDINIGGECEEKAIETLGKLGPLAKSAVPSLIAAVKSNDDDNCWRAIEALGEIGPDAREALPTLKTYLNSEADLRRRAKEAIRKIEAQ